ncbi:uncharacterized protein MCYG_02683 [Microsporum canis CBS 113480]|uniref:Uncharacterized protein n=1 Tax=Arthroderma otae (strain ATCC MYA-4605 / CBS 113480) TaxID=554155 RepID=C5FGH9_ARTOC|nr:uncharacterized protein MCYG_02683 [Microsporum canis CBS 113480]EEQ29864.1 predicted protein [Microsporum canis CBS 113480]
MTPVGVYWIKVEYGLTILKGRLRMSERIESFFLNFSGIHYISPSSKAPSASRFASVHTILVIDCPFSIFPGIWYEKAQPSWIFGVCRSNSIPPVNAGNIELRHVDMP